MMTHGDEASASPTAPPERAVLSRCEVCEAPLERPPCTRCGGRVVRSDLLEPPPDGMVAELAAGLRLAVRGAGLTLRTPRLAALVVLPLLLSFLLFAAMVVLIWSNRDVLRPDLTTAWPLGLDWLRAIVAASAQGLALLLGVAAAVVATVILSQAVNAPFLEWLSQAVESLVVGQTDRTAFSLRHLWRTTIVPLFQALGVAAVQALLGGLLLVLSLFGVTAPLAAIGGVWLVALTLCDVAIARKGFPVRERFRRVRRALPLYLGLALPFFLAPFLLPLGVAGATLAVLRERRFAGVAPGGDAPERPGA